MVFKQLVKAWAYRVVTPQHVEGEVSSVKVASILGYINDIASDIWAVIPEPIKVLGEKISGKLYLARVDHPAYNWAVVYIYSRGDIPIASIYFTEGLPKAVEYIKDFLSHIYTEAESIIGGVGYREGEAKAREIFSSDKFKKLVEMFSEITGMKPEEAEHTLKRMIEEYFEEQYIDKALKEHKDILDSIAKLAEPLEQATKKNTTEAINILNNSYKKVKKIA